MIDFLFSYIIRFEFENDNNKNSVTSDVGQILGHISGDVLTKVPLGNQVWPI